MAIAVVAYALANIVHEGLGHGGACLALGGRLLAFSAVHAQCDVAEGAESLGVMASGTLANLGAGAGALAAVRMRQAPATKGHYFLWLFMTVNLLQGTGYWLFSGLANVGDWAQMTAGLDPRWPYRVALTIAGTAGYTSAIALSLRHLSPIAGWGPCRSSRARTLTLVPYVAGGALYVAAGALNPVSPALVLISAAAASFGGTSALAWTTRRLDRRRDQPTSDAPLVVERSPAWVAAGVVAALVFVVLLEPGIRF